MAVFMLTNPVTIDGHDLIDAELHEHVDLVDITTEYEPDPDWIHVDSAGHLHAWSYDGHDTSLPTLHRIDIQEPCNGGCGQYGDCEGFTRPEYHCVICDELVHPKTRHTKGRKTMPGRTTWEVTFRTQRLPQLRRDRMVCIVWHDQNGPKRFGIAQIMKIEQQLGDLVHATAVGIGELGNRGAATRSGGEAQR